MNQGERVNTLRKKLGMTLEQFGKNLGVSKVAISHIENNKCNLSKQMTLLICNTYNVNEKWLTEGTGDIFRKTISSELEAIFDKYNCDKLDRAIVCEYLKLNKESRQVFKNFFFKIETVSDEDLNILSKPDNLPDTPEELEKLFPPVELDDNKDVG